MFYLQIPIIICNNHFIDCGMFVLFLICMNVKKFILYNVCSLCSKFNCYFLRLEEVIKIAEQDYQMAQTLVSHVTHV